MQFWKVFIRARLFDVDRLISIEACQTLSVGPTLVTLIEYRLRHIIMYM